MRNRYTCNMSLQVEGIKSIPNLDMFVISYINNELYFYILKVTLIVSLVITLNSSEKGLIIENSICFDQMVDLFKSVDRPLMANVTGSNNPISISGVLL